MDKFTKILILKEYEKDIEYYYEQISMLSKFLNVQDKTRRMALDKTIKIIKKRIKQLKACETLDDYNEIINVNKLIKKKGDYYESKIT